jgi:hypothetical protein
MQGEVRIAQELTSQQHYIRLTTAYDFACLLSRGDQPDSASQNPCLGADAVCEWDLIPRRERNPLTGR